MKQKPLCLAPWVHSFVHTSGERAFCCISRRLDLNESPFWNSDSWREARLDLLNGNLPSSCEACSYSEFPLYQQFEQKFGHLKEEILSKTSDDGSFEGSPISFDHRNSYVCNFKCRMCNSEYSSLKKKEQIELFGKDSLPEWMTKDSNGGVERFHREYTEKELMNAVESRRVKEIYWAGGEPLLNPFHWKVMRRIFELDLQHDVFIRYNTNLSKIEFLGRNFFEDIFSKIPNCILMVSLDATQKVGEFVRTGLDWDEFQKNFKQALQWQTDTRQVAISLCLTTPGIFDLKNMLSFATAHSTSIQAQLVDFGSQANFENPLHPQFFPKEIRDPWIRSTLEDLSELRNAQNESLFQLLESLLFLPDQELSSERIKNIKGTLKKAFRIDIHRGGERLSNFLDPQPLMKNWLKQFNLN